MERKKAVIYVRTAQNNEKNVNKQIKSCLEYAESNNYELIKTYIDDGYSGSNNERPGLKKMFIDRKKFDIVLVSDHSRISRDLIFIWLIKNKLKSNNIEVISIKQTTKTENVLPSIFGNLESYLSNYY